MTKKKSKKKKKKPTLTREEFAFLCDLIMKGADQELDEIWDDMADWNSRYSQPNDDTLLMDAVTDEEVKLFHKVDRLLHIVSQRFGYAQPLFSQDLEFGMPVVKPASKPLVAKAPPPLVVAKAL